jgi:uncharacterized protein (DUF1697 family)
MRGFLVADELVAVLVRGINVGKAKRVAMADLRALLESLGYASVRTLLNSGNAVCGRSKADSGDPGSRIEAAMARKLGISARVMVLSRADLALIVRENSLAKIADDPSRLQVAVTASRADLARLEPLRTQSWGKEKLAVGTRAAYLWCPEGVIKSALYRAVDRALGDSMTARNWATAQKLHQMMEP